MKSREGKRTSRRISAKAGKIPSAIVLEEGSAITRDTIKRIQNFVNYVVKSKRGRGPISATFACEKCGKDVVVTEVTCPECADGGAKG